MRIVIQPDEGALRGMKPVNENSRVMLFRVDQNTQAVKFDLHGRSALVAVTLDKLKGKSYIEFSGNSECMYDTFEACKKYLVGSLYARKGTVPPNVNISPFKDYRGRTLRQGEFIGHVEDLSEQLIAWFLLRENDCHWFIQLKMI